MILEEEKKSKKIKRICKWCGTSFEIWPSKIRERRGIFCSRNCYYNWVKSENKRIEKICPICGKKFTVDPSRIKQGKGKFCSRRCMGLWQSENLIGENSSAWKAKIDCICLQCGKEFKILPSKVRDNRGKFCSRECTDKWKHKSNSGKGNPAWRGGKIKRICEICGKKFEIDPCEIRKGWGRFCSHSCARKGRKGFPTHHTKPELIFEELCKKNNLPFRYVGDSSFWIGKKPSFNPDFIECNGKKIAIEIFSYWHNPLQRFGDVAYLRTYNGRKEAFKKIGWKLVVFWQEDLEREDADQFILNELQKQGIM